MGPDIEQDVKAIRTRISTLGQDIYNQLLRDEFVPNPLKRSIISPVPKVCPLKTSNRT